MPENSDNKAASVFAGIIVGLALIGVMAIVYFVVSIMLPALCS